MTTNKDALDALDQIEKIVASQIGGAYWPSVFKVIRQHLAADKTCPHTINSFKSPPNEANYFDPDSYRLEKEYIRGWNEAIKLTNSCAEIEAS